MKEIIKELAIFRIIFRDRQDFSDEIQASISLIKDEIQNSIEKAISHNKSNEKLFWLDSDGIRNC